MNTKKRNIKIIITTKGCDRKDAVIGNFRNGRLQISFYSLPELIYVIVDEQFTANEGELCLGQLREKLNNCEGVTVSTSEILCHEIYSHNCLFGATQIRHNELTAVFIERDYFIVYSLYNFAMDM